MTRISITSLDYHRPERSSSTDTNSPFHEMISAFDVPHQSTAVGPPDPPIDDIDSRAFDNIDGWLCTRRRTMSTVVDCASQRSEAVQTDRRCRVALCRRVRINSTRSIIIIIIIIITIIIIIIALDNAPYKMLQKLKSACPIRKNQL